MTHHNADELAGLAEKIDKALRVASNPDHFCPAMGLHGSEWGKVIAALRHPQQPQGGVVSELRAALLSSPCPHPVANAGDDRSVRKCVEIGACGCENKAALAALPSPVAEDGSKQLRASKPKLEVEKLQHHSDCRVNDFTFRDMAAASDCSCGAVVEWYEMVLRAIFDPENQPSQFGTTIAATPVPPVAQSELSDRELEQVEYARQQEKETASALVPLVHVANITRLLAIIDRLSGDSKNG